MTRSWRSTAHMTMPGKITIVLRCKMQTGQSESKEALEAVMELTSSWGNAAEKLAELTGGLVL